MKSLFKEIKEFEKEGKLKQTETNVTHLLKVIGDKPADPEPLPEKMGVKEKVYLKGTLGDKHGWLGNRDWEAPRMVVKSELDARPGYNTRKSHEFYESPEVLREKVKLLATLIRRSKNCIAYTGAGISTGAGIGDYASRSTGGKSLSQNKGIRLHSMFDAQPTKAHRVLTSLYNKGHLKHWIQQNHDGLPQKAGFPQSEINEIHGAWYDCANPVVKMSGNLRGDLFEHLIKWESKADLCLALGTSLCGMNADRVAATCAKKAMKLINKKKNEKALGTVIVALQQTQLDSKASLRIFAKIDEVMELLNEEMKLPEINMNLKYVPNVPKEYIVKEDVYKILFDKNGKPSKGGERTILDLREGQKVRLTGGPHKGDIGEICSRNREGHIKIRFRHIMNKKHKIRAPLIRVFGLWWIQAGVEGKGIVPGGLFPIVSVDPNTPLD